MKTLTLTLICLALTAQAQNSPTRVWTGYGENNGDYFGGGITGGDFNADGYSDVLIGAGGWGSYGSGNGAIGRDYLYLGSPDFFDSAAFVFQGDTAWDSFDWGVSNVQDVNGDNIEDLLIPAAYHIPGGYVEIFFGGQDFDTLADWRAQKQAIQYFEYFGESNDSAGDVNGDGWCDFVISGGDYELNWRYFEIYYGGPALDTVADWRYSTEQFNNCPFSVAGLGDVNGDGYDDILAYKPVYNAPYFPGLLFYGGNPMDTIPDLEFTQSVTCGAGVGDLNGDGYDDIALDRNNAPTKVYLGSAEMDTVSDVGLQGFNVSVIGSQVISQGDVNGDGFSDIICDASGYAGIYLGSHWFNGILDWWYTEFYMYDGFNLGGVGDVNGDGCDDFILGLDHYNYPFNQGRAYLYAGNPNMVDNGAGISPEELLRHPGWFKLDQNYPNPFNSTTSIHFELGKPSTVNLSIYDLRGRRVQDLIAGDEMLPGGYNVSWNSRNEQKQQVSSGIYLLELQVDQYRQMKKLVLIR